MSTPLTESPPDARVSHPAPLNRPTVLTLAGITSMSRVIPASRVEEIERIAVAALSAGERIRQVEAHRLEEIDDKTHAAWVRGYTRGHEEALEKLREFFTALESRRRFLDAELIGLVADAVGKIVRNLPPALITENLIEAALLEARDVQGRLVLRVHPDCVKLAEATLREKSEGLRVTVEADAALAKDDCILETPAGLIEAGLSTQLEALRTVLFGNSEAASA